MKRLLSVVSFLRSLPDCRIQMDGEGLMAYALVAFMGVAGCIGTWNYGWYLIDQGQSLQGSGLIVLTGLMGLLLLLVPLFYEPAAQTTPTGDELVPEPVTEDDLDEHGRNF